MTESSQHRRGGSFHVNWTATDIPRLAQEVYEQTIADVHLSLLSYWILDKEQHYTRAKQHIRELALDQGYNVDRIQNLKLRKLLHDTYAARPEVTHAEESESESESENPANTHRKKSESQWLRDTLQQLDSSLDLNTLPTVHSGDRTEKGLSKTPSQAVNVAKKRTKSSPRMARVESLPGSLRSQRQRLMEEAALSISVGLPESPTSIYPPDTPDRPAPLSLRSISSPCNKAAPETPTAATRNASGPLATSALESVEVDTGFNTIIRQSYLSPRARYAFNTGSPRARRSFTSPLLQPSRYPPTGVAAETIEEAEADDVFGVAGRGSAQIDTYTNELHAKSEHYTSSVRESADSHSQYSQDSGSHLSDSDWHTLASGEDEDIDEDIDETPMQPTFNADILGREYEAFLTDAREDPNSQLSLTYTPIRSRYALHPEDETEDEDADSHTFPAYEASNDEASLLKTASNASEEVTTRYQYLSSPLVCSPPLQPPPKTALPLPARPPPQRALPRSKTMVKRAKAIMGSLSRLHLGRSSARSAPGVSVGSSSSSSSRVRNKTTHMVGTSRPAARAPTVPLTASIVRSNTHIATLLAQSRSAARSRQRIELASLSEAERAWRARHAGVLAALFGAADVWVGEEEKQTVEGIAGVLEGLGRGW